MKKLTTLMGALALALATLGGLATGCGGNTTCTPAETPDAGAQQTAAKNYRIDLLANHAHIYRKVAQVFTVYDMDTCTSATDVKTCKAISGLPLKVILRAPKATDSTEQAIEQGKFEDNKDGTYTYYSTFGGLGAYTLSVKFTQDGHDYFSAWALETSKGGNEKMFCDSDMDGTDDLSYQVRWDASAEHIFSNNTEITFNIELMRSFNTPIITDKPYNNKFDHLAPANVMDGKPTVKLMADSGASAKEIATLDATYAGKGIYQVKRSFTDADLGDAMSRTFWLKVTFMDGDHMSCTMDASSSAADFEFPVDMVM
jgi:hypothetical protein